MMSSFDKNKWFEKMMSLFQYLLHVLGKKTQGLNTKIIFSQKKILKKIIQSSSYAD